MIDGCHRSRSAEIGFTPVTGFTRSGFTRSGLTPATLPANLTFRNLACSGATTATDTSGLLFKPGIDFYPASSVFTANPNVISTREGQALQLERVAKEAAVRMVVLSIGGNDFHFSDVITACLETYLLDVVRNNYHINPIYCKNDPAVTKQVDATARYQRKIAIYRAMQNVYDAMRGAGYAPSEWTFVIQLYPAPLPASTDFRYPEFAQQNVIQRQFDGGCGVMNQDVDWARNTFLATVNQEVMAAGRMLETQLVGNDNILYLHTNPTFVNHTLCSKTTSLVTNSPGWRASGAAKRAEWITQIRVLTKLAPRSPTYQLQESLHPDYWGQLAMRNCLRQLWNNGAGPPVGRAGPGTQWHCNDETNTTPSGLNDFGEPLVKLYARATGTDVNP